MKKVSDTDIRLAMLDPELRKRIEYFSLGEKELNLLRTVGVGLNTPRAISDQYAWALSLTTQKLEALVEKGYLKRSLGEQPRGGIGYIYFNVYASKLWG